MKIIFILLVAVAAVRGQDCTWDRDTDFPEFPSLIMNEATWQSVLPVLEGAVRTIRIAGGSSVVIACTGTTIIATGTDVVEGVCNGGSVLNVGGTDYDMQQLGCVSRIQESILKNLGSCGDGNLGEQHAIGYDVTGYSFYGLILVCFDPILETALSTNHLLRGVSVSASDGNPSRPSFKTDSGFFTVSANTCYEIASQEALMGDILGDSSVIDSDNSLYFARGHMSPDADFLTEMEADATYYYINAVPQWQAINNGNWKFLEEATRDLASAHGTDFQIWNGPWRILKLDDTTGNPVEIYLGLTEGESVIPAPELTWKVIYESSSNRAVAVVISNNPYLTAYPTPICADICSSISWITFDVNDLVKGATYCCTVQDLQSAVPNAPDLGSVGLLDS